MFTLSVDYNQLELYKQYQLILLNNTQQLEVIFFLRLAILATLFVIDSVSF